MISKKLRMTCYFLAGPLMKLNGIFYRRFRVPKGDKIKVHLGPGQRRYLQGWINLDANIVSGKCDVWVDLSNKLPFNDDLVDAFYSHHVIEHLKNVEFHISEVFRCLKPGGIYRVGGPNCDAAIKKFHEGDALWFSDYPDKRESLGGKLDNFILCRQEHLMILTASFLKELLMNAGFINIKSCIPTKETGFTDLFSDCLAIETENDFVDTHTLILEAEKAKT